MSMPGVPHRRGRWRDRNGQYTRRRECAKHFAHCHGFVPHLTPQRLVFLLPPMGGYGTITSRVERGPARWWCRDIVRRSCMLPDVANDKLLLIKIEGMHCHK